MQLRYILRLSELLVARRLEIDLKSRHFLDDLHNIAYGIYLCENIDVFT